MSSLPELVWCRYSETSSRDVDVGKVFIGCCHVLSMSSALCWCVVHSLAVLYKQSRSYFAPQGNVTVLCWALTKVRQCCCCRLVSPMSANVSFRADQLAVKTKVKRSYCIFFSSFPFFSDAICNFVICNDSSLRSQPIIFNPDFFVEKLRHEKPEVFTELVVSNITRLIDLPGAELAQLMGEEDPKLPGANSTASGFFRSLISLKRKGEYGCHEVWCPPLEWCRHHLLHLVYKTFSL